MEFIDIPTEQTTAFTDIILALMAASAAVYLHRIGQINRFKTNIWIWVFGLLALAAILGSIAHGFSMSGTLQTSLWHLINLSLGLLVALFGVAVAYDIWGKTIARRVLPMMMLIGVGFFGITLVWPDDFQVFIYYEAVVMVFALGGYTWLAYRGHLEGAWLMVAGVLVSIIAASVQSGNALLFTFIWIFDHNGIYHVIQMVGLVFLVTGLAKALRRRHTSAA